MAKKITSAPLDNFGPSDTAAADLKAANTLPDDFDLLIREAMFAAGTGAPSARSATFTTGSRGLEGPLSGVMGISGAVDLSTGILPEDFDVTPSNWLTRHTKNPWNTLGGK